MINGRIPTPSGDSIAKSSQDRFDQVSEEIIEKNLMSYFSLEDCFRISEIIHQKMRERANQTMEAIANDIRILEEQRMKLDELINPICHTKGL